MLERPPQHRADATPIYIDESDKAWDRERIESELAAAHEANRVARAAYEKALEAGEEVAEPVPIDTKQHPFALYFRGSTRYDLEAQMQWRGTSCKITDYLKPDQEPTRFVLRRLGWDEYFRVDSALGRDWTQGLILSCRLTLANVTGDPRIKVDPELSQRSHEEMQTLFNFSPRLVLNIGGAGRTASQPLTDAEKKA